MTVSKISSRNAAEKQKRSTFKSAKQRSDDARKSVPAEGKIAIIVSLMRRPNGVTVTELTQKTGWQAHSVRGAISSIVKRKLGLRILSEKVGTTRVYRIPEAEEE
jgi:predicted HTH transcriptional regulator